MTVTIQIGNSDDRLTQARWSHFVSAVATILAQHGGQVHFAGGSDTAHPWQNFAWVAECRDDRVEEIIKALSSIRANYGQDSVAVTTGTTRFV